MQTRIRNGIIGGLVGGILFGLMMQFMAGPDGAAVMMMVAAVVRSKSLIVGWVYHLFNSAVIGAIFGGVLGERVTDYRLGVIWGLVYGLIWWVLGALILMPVLLGMAPFAALAMAPMRPVALGSLVGHLLYGVVLGVVFAALRQ